MARHVLPYIAPMARLPHNQGGSVDDSEGYYETLQRAIAQLRIQLAFLPLDDPRRSDLYRDLLWSYHEAFALLYRRMGILRKQHQARFIAD